MEWTGTSVFTSCSALALCGCQENEATSGGMLSTRHPCCPWRMVECPMSKKKKKNSRNPALQANVRIVKPSAALKTVVRLLDEIDDEAHDAVRRSFPTEYSPLYNFDQGVLVRGINTLKSVRLLVENGHWEMAHSLLRQLLELLANIEFLFTMQDRSKATLQYMKFGLLQKITEQILSLQYDEAAGRPIDQERLAKLEAYREGSTFDEFKAKTKDGSLKFVTSWCRRNMKELCEASDSPLRVSQYELLYSPWSEQVHAAPGALIDSMMRNVGTGWQELVIEEDEVRIHEAVSMAISLFLELRRFLPAIDAPDPDKAHDWLERAKPKKASAV